MRRSWAAVTVGTMALIVSGLSYGLFRFTSERMGAKDGIAVYALFRDAMGLVPKSRVVIAGLQVGRIIDLAPDEGSGKAKVTISINPGVCLFQDAQVMKKSASLLGEFYLEIIPGNPIITEGNKKTPAKVLGDGDRIINVFEPTSINDIVNEVGTTLPILKEILRDVQQMTSGSVKKIAENVNQLAERNAVVIDRLLARVDNITANIESITRDEADDIRTSIKNVRDITESVKGLVGTSKGEVTATGTEIRSSLQKLQKSIDSLESSMENVDQITGKVNDGKGTIGHLVNDDGIAKNIEEITEDAGGFIRSVVRLQTTIGLRTEYNGIANTFKNYFHITLSPRPDRFYLIEIVDDPRGLREKTRTRIESSDKQLVDQTTITTSEKLRFSLMFGQRLGMVTGRFGIKESTGGLGMDLHFLEDRLTLSTDLFDTRSNEYPRLQGRAQVAVFRRNLYLVGGVDDILNQEQSLSSGGAFFDWFLGLNLMFRDEDLKTLLMFGGGAAASATSR